MPVYGQGFVPGFNAVYPALLNKIGKTIISSNNYTSPFSRFVASLEVGEYIENIHLNPGVVLLHNTVTNSNMLENFDDDLATAYSAVNLDFNIPSTYTEYNVRMGSTLLENVSSLITAFVANLRTTFEYRRNEEVKQMLYNGYMYGVLDAITISDPTLSPEHSGAFAVALNSAIDDFRTEISTRDVPYNNQIGLAEGDKRMVISDNMPLVITFNDYIRYAEFWNAVNLAWVGRFRTENSNMDWQNRIIALNRDDFPKSIPTRNRSAVTGSDVVATDINFWEMPKNMKTGEDLYSGTPKGGDTILAFVLDPEAIMLDTQLDVTTNFQNPATLAVTNRIIYRGVEDFNAFKKIRVITCNAGEEVTPTPPTP